MAGWKVVGRWGPHPTQVTAQKKEADQLGQLQVGFWVIPDLERRAGGEPRRGEANSNPTKVN